MRIFWVVSCLLSLGACSQEQYQAMYNAGQALQGVESQPQRMGTGMLKSQYTQGFNKVCIYDNVGSVDTLVISATSLCPLTK